MKRIHNEMRDIMEKVGFEGTLQEFFVHMRNSDEFVYPNTEEGRQKYLNEAKATADDMRGRLDELFINKPKADSIVKAVEPFREKSAGKAFYQQPSMDGSRPGTYYANLYDMTAMPTYQMEALAYRRGYPWPPYADCYPARARGHSRSAALAAILLTAKAGACIPRSCLRRLVHTKTRTQTLVA